MDYIFKSSPKFLQAQHSYKSFVSAIEEEIVRLQNANVDAIRQGLISKCAPDALRYHGENLHLPQLPNETTENYRNRLLSYSATSSPRAIFKVLERYGLSNSIIIRERTNPTGNSYYYDATSTINQLTNVFVSTLDNYVNGWYKWNKLWIVAKPFLNTNLNWTTQYSTRAQLVAAHATMNSYLATGNVGGSTIKQVDIAKLKSEIVAEMPMHLTDSDWQFHIFLDATSTFCGVGSPSLSTPFSNTSNILRLH